MLSYCVVCHEGQSTPATDQQPVLSTSRHSGLVALLANCIVFLKSTHLFLEQIQMSRAVGDEQSKDVHVRMVYKTFTYISQWFP